MKTVLYLIVAVVFLAAGAFAYLSSNNVTAADQLACEQQVQLVYGSSPEQIEQLATRCKSAGMVAMMNAQVNNLSAEQSAQNIANANQGGLIKTLIACVLFGGGIGALGAAFRSARDRRKISSI